MPDGHLRQLRHDGQRRPALTCARFLSDYAPGPVRVEPLANFPVVRDLVVGIDDFMRKLPRVKPWLVREDEPGVADAEFLQTPAELDEYRQYSMCINSCSATRRVRCTP